MTRDVARGKINDRVIDWAQQVPPIHRPTCSIIIKNFWRLKGRLTKLNNETIGGRGLRKAGQRGACALELGYQSHVLHV